MQGSNTLTSGGTRANRPNSKCPSCVRYDIGFNVFADTRDLEDEAMHLFLGIQERRDGLTVLMADKTKALGLLADHFGIFENPSKTPLVRSLAWCPNFYGLKERTPAPQSAKTRWLKYWNEQEAVDLRRLFSHVQGNCIVSQCNATQSIACLSPRVRGNLRRSGPWGSGRRAHPRVCRGTCAQ